MLVKPFDSPKLELIALRRGGWQTKRRVTGTSIGELNRFVNPSTVISGGLYSQTLSLPFPSSRKVYWMLN